MLCGEGGDFSIKCVLIEFAYTKYINKCDIYIFILEIIKLKTGFLLQKSFWICVSSAVNSQRLLCSQKVGVNFSY